MRQRIAAHLAQTCAFAAAIAVVNRWFLMAAGFTLLAMGPLYFAGSSDEETSPAKDPPGRVFPDVDAVVDPEPEHL